MSKMIVTTGYGTPRGDVQIPALANKSYRPANGTSGDIFEEIVCGSCAFFSNGDCTEGIYDAALFNDQDEADYPKEFIYDGDGSPTCTAWEDARLKSRNARDERVRYERALRDVE